MGLNALTPILASTITAEHFNRNDRIVTRTQFYYRAGRADIWRKHRGCQAEVSLAVTCPIAASRCKVSAMVCEPSISCFRGNLSWEINLSSGMIWCR